MATVPGNQETLASFQRQPVDALKSVKAGEPLVITVRGKAKYVVQDATAYRRLLRSLDRAEAVAGIRRGLKDADEGRTIPFEQFRAEQTKKHGLRG
jgi:prevent-host-death family protein